MRVSLGTDSHTEIDLLEDARELEISFAFAEDGTRRPGSREDEGKSALAQRLSSNAQLSMAPRVLARRVACWKRDGPRTFHCRSQRSVNRRCFVRRSVFEYRLLSLKNSDQGCGCWRPARLSKLQDMRSRKRSLRGFKRLRGNYGVDRTSSGNEERGKPLPNLRDSHVRGVLRLNALRSQIISTSLSSSQVGKGACPALLFSKLTQA